MIVREMESEDTFEVFQLAHSLFPDSNISMKGYDLIFVAEDEDIVGFLHMGWIKGKVVIKGIGVREDHQGRGIATLLMEEVLSKISTESEIHLKVKCDNFSALRLYQKHGFFIKKFGSSLVMVKKQNS